MDDRLPARNLVTDTEHSDVSARHKLHVGDQDCVHCFSIRTLCQGELIGALFATRAHASEYEVEVLLRSSDSEIGAELLSAITDTLLVGGAVSVTAKVRDHDLSMCTAARRAGMSEVDEDSDTSDCTRRFRRDRSGRRAQIVIVGGSGQLSLAETDFVVVNSVEWDDLTRSDMLSIKVARDDFNVIQDVLDARWDSFLTSHRGWDGIDTFSYLYFILASRIAFWERIKYATERESSSPIAYLVAEGTLGDRFSQQVSSISSFVEWSCARFWTESLRGMPHVTVVGSGLSNSRSPRSNGVEFIGFIVRGWRARREITDGLLKRLGIGRRRHCRPLLVISQPVKFGGLRKSLRTVISREEREAAPGYQLGKLRRPIAFDDGCELDLWSDLDRYVEECWQEIQEHLTSARALLEDVCPEIVLTDHEYDPLVRLLIREGSPGNSRHRFVLIPEGAQSRLGSKTRRFFGNWHFHHAGLERWSLSPQDAEVARSWLGHEANVVGYLADSQGKNSVLSAVVLRLLRTRCHGRIALINVDGEIPSPCGLARPSGTTNEMEVQSLVRAVRVLNSRGWTGLVTCRNHSFASLIRDHLRDHDVQVFSRCPWQYLASAADVVIQRDSSLGVEAASLGHPVVVWNPFKLPLASEHEIRRGAFHIAEDETELGVALEMALIAEPVSVQTPISPVSVENALRRLQGQGNSWYGQ